MAQHDQQTSQIADQANTIRRMEGHRDNQERLHALGQEHDQSFCRHCTGQQLGQTYTYTMPPQVTKSAYPPKGNRNFEAVKDSMRSWSSEAVANHKRMLEKMKELQAIEKLKKSYDPESLFDNALFHSQGLLHNVKACPRCEKGEKFQLSSFYKTNQELREEYYEKTGRRLE